MKKASPKILVVIITFTILVGGLSLPPTTVADPFSGVGGGGGYPVFDAANLSAKIVQIGKDVAQWAKNDLSKSLRDAVAKRIIDYIVDQTTTWIQGGGTPKYITDWNGFLQDVQNRAFDEVINEVGAAALCQPFKLNVQIGLQPVPKFDQRVSCTLDKVVQNINDFYNNFQNGGWIAYNYEWQPNNNYIGVLLTAQDQALLQAAQEGQAAVNEGLAGHGFLDTKKCLQYASTTDGGTKCLKYETVTPGDIAGAAMAKAVNADTEWAVNIQSWTSALVNAVINRVITGGIGALKGTSSSSGSSYYPAEYSTVASTATASDYQQLADNAHRLINEWQSLLTSKQQSLSDAQQILSLLNAMNTNNCQPAVTNSEIQQAQSTVNDLQSYVNYLQTALAEGDKVISELDNSQNSLQAQMTATDDYNAFMDKYDTTALEEQIIDGSNRQTAQNEMSQENNLLSETQTRATTCKLVNGISSYSPVNQ